MMKTKFMIEGGNVSVIKMNDETALDALPPRFYTARFSPLHGFYLSMGNEQLQVPEVIYGNTQARVDKCLESYITRDTSTGILLTGDKGTGKTLLMALLANDIVTKLNLPVILIRDPYEGEQFMTFIEQIGECCLMFDEFGKMYSSSRHDDKVKQEALLSLMDGVDKTKRMILLSENSEIDISEFMLNRPSRVYYHFRYKKLDEASTKGYCADHDVPSDIIGDIVELSRRSKIFSFDMLQSIVEEYQRFEQSVEEIVVDLNIDIRQEAGKSIEIIKVIQNDTGEERQLTESAIVTQPSGQHSYTYISLKSKKAKRGNVKSAPSLRSAEVAVSSSEDDEEDEFHITSADLAYASAGKLVYETTEYTVVAKEIEQSHTDYYKYF